jgi:hypothetical protein
MVLESSVAWRGAGAHPLAQGSFGPGLLPTVLADR